MDATALFKLTSGLYVVSASDGKRNAGCIINTALQVTNSPLQISVTVNKENYTCDVIKDAGHFTVTALSQKADMLLIGRFGFRSSRDYDKFDGIDSELSATSDPYTKTAACALIACKTVEVQDVGTHLTFVGEVVDAQKLSDDEPLTYAYYHSVLKGKTPKKASSYIPAAS